MDAYWAVGILLGVLLGAVVIYFANRIASLMGDLLILLLWGIYNFLRRGINENKSAD